MCGLILSISGLSLKAGEDSDGLYIPQRLMRQAPENPKISPQPITQVQGTEQFLPTSENPEPKLSPLEQSRAKSHAKRGKIISLASKILGWAKYACNPELLVMDKAVSPVVAKGLFVLQKKEIVKEVKIYLDLMSEIPQLRQNCGGNSLVLFRQILEKLSNISDDLTREFMLLILGKTRELTLENFDAKIKAIDPETIFDHLTTIINNHLYYLTGNKKYNPTGNPDLPTIKSELGASVLEGVHSLPILPILKVFVAPMVLNRLAVNRFAVGYNAHRTQKYDYSCIESKLNPSGPDAGKLKLEFASDEAVKKAFADYQLKHRITGPTINKPDKFEARENPMVQASKLLLSTHGQANLITTLLYALSAKNPTLKNWATGFAILNGIVDFGYTLTETAKVCHSPNKQALGMDKTLALLNLPDSLRTAWYNGQKGRDHKYTDNTKPSLGLSIAMPALKTGGCLALSKYFKTPEGPGHELAIDVATKSFIYELITKLERSNFKCVTKHPFYTMLSVSLAQTLSEGLVNPIAKEVVKSMLKKFRKTKSDESSDESDSDDQEMFGEMVSDQD